MMGQTEEDTKIDDEEDDYEGYFLVPVNEYKIADKIISANKSLFECSAPEEPLPPEAREKIESDANVEVKRPRVTFSSDIEEYDDESTGSNEASGDEASLKASAEKEQLSNQLTEENVNNNILPKEDVNQGSVHDGKDETDEHIIEEICEDIEAIKFENTDESEVAEEIDENINETDNVDLPPPLGQAAENIDAIETPTTNESSQETVVEVEESIKHVAKPRTFGSARSTPSKTAKVSLRPRKALSNPSSRKSSLTTPKLPQKDRPTTTSNNDSDNLLRIQLNFKCCCEHKYRENSRLPRYRGYFSQYGLSKEELDARAERRQLTRQMKYENWLRKNEERAIKTFINEHAFSQWLLEKSRSQRGKDQNMYDYDIHGKRLPRKVYKGVVHAESWKH